MTFTELETNEPTVTYACGTTPETVTKIPLGVANVTYVVLPGATVTVTDLVVLPWWIVTVAEPA